MQRRPQDFGKMREKNNYDPSIGFTELHQLVGLSIDTTLEPPQNTQTTTALAFSS